jgi:hypothetical protein
MKLTDLEPRWIHPNLFVFRCPHCRSVFLSCKNSEMSDAQQCDLFEKEFGEDFNLAVVGCKPDFSWSISGAVPADRSAAFIQNLTVTPSIDASASGHWHGFITNGEIR